jgi:hypothetical protein
LLTDLIHTAEDDVLDAVRIDLRTADEITHHECREMVGTFPGKLAVSASYRSTHGTHNEGVSHEWCLLISYERYKSTNSGSFYPSVSRCARASARVAGVLHFVPA